jgi:hypothetical protein
MNIPATLKPVWSVISRKQVGLVTLTSVSQSPMTSRPARKMPAVFQHRAEGGSDLGIAGSQGPGDAGAAGREVAARLAGGGDARQAEGHGNAVDDQDALVAVLDFRDVALRHDGFGAVPGEGFDDHAEVGVVRPETEDRRAAHGVERFQNDVAVLVEEFPQQAGAAGHQGRHGELREAGGGEFFVEVAQAGGAIVDLGALAFGEVQQIGVIQVFLVEGRVLAHQHRVEIGQVAPDRSPASNQSGKRPVRRTVWASTATRPPRQTRSRPSQASMT